MKKMDSYKVFKGKTGTPSFSMRYNAEDDELEQLIESQPSEDTPTTEEIRDTVSEIQDTKKLRDSPVLSKVIKRSSSLDDSPGETWKFFTDIKGRITKTVEEKIEEIKSDRMKKREKKKLTTGGENSSVSDSEEKSDASTSIAVSAAASLGASASQATSAKESEEEDELTEMDVSDSTPVRELGPSFDKPRPKISKKRASIEVAEEAFEEGVTTILPNQETVLGKPLVDPVESQPTASTSVYNTVSVTVYNLLKKHWAVVLPLILALLMAYTPLPREILWACLGGLVVMEYKQVSDWFQFRPTGDPSNPEENCLFTGSFHLDSFHILPDQMRQLPSSDPETATHQGWLNEYNFEYSGETYKLRDTMCIWASLRGPLLTISIPVRPPPHKAFWSEPQHPRAFTHHRLYNLTNCKVTLLPEGLTNKRVWSKKYPIHIQLTEESYVGSSYKDPVDKDTIRIKNLDTSGQLYNPQHCDADVASEALDEVKKESLTHKTPGKKTADGVDGLDLTESSDNEEDISIDKTNVAPSVDEPEYLDYVHVSPTLVEKKLYLCLFARSDREKEIWFRRLIASIGYNSSSVVTDDLPSAPISDNIQTLKGCREKLNKSYLDFMYNLAQAMPKPGKRRRKRCKDGYSGSMWFNVFISRIYYDFINNPVCMSILQEKVQRKLSTVRLPGIVEELVVSRLVVEGPGPVVDGWSEPRLDSSGVWADIDISYQGLTSITIDIHINLTGKKKDSLPPSPQKGGDEKRSAVFNSSVEDSGESSTDSDDNRLDSTQPVPKKPSNSPSVVNRITHKYFNQVAESKLVKKALEGVSSNTHISLIVEVKALVGTLVINIPPPPTNRIWYGFRPKPKLCLRARPVLGETVVSLVNISNWIEKKLYREFEKILVLPNMDDLVIPLMDRNIPF